MGATRAPAPVKLGSGRDSGRGPLASGKQVGGVTVVAADVGEMDPEALLELSDRLKQKAAHSAILLGSRSDGRVHLVANFSEAAVERGANASDIVKVASGVVGGGGGGRPTMARAGGKDPEKLTEAITVGEQALLAALA